jgi:hypothetical protein
MDSSKAFEGGEHLKANGLEWFVAQHTCCGGTQGQIEVQDQKEKEKDATMEELVIAPKPWLVGSLVMKRPRV